ncbi:MAG: TrmO family methyltransferase [candidate division Zixibacteria bacterium]|jgi:tRNA-Thr(GGU) m(6)t(6)A37 methyltransferase TsaA|nr:TrmO family methyltransferase [candidate division Zixibacteria bacterium]
MYIVAPVAWVSSTYGDGRDGRADQDIATIMLDDRMPDEALDGVEEFSHLEIILYFHKADPARINPELSHPRGNPAYSKVGVVARRGPNRPNHLGLTVVEVVQRDGRKVIVRGRDALDGSPVIDIRPLMTGLLPRSPVRQPRWADEIMSEHEKNS